jgi:DDE superfamily endonuclease
LPLSGSDRTSGHANGSVEHFCYRLGVALRSSLLARRIRRALVRADSVVPAISVDKDRNLRVVYAQVGRDLPAHKVAGVAEAIEAAGATLIYLPKYSPDFNPIELAFSKLKAHLRKAAEHTILRLLRRDRPRRYRFQPARMQELLSSCRLCSIMTGICSSLLRISWSTVPVT